MKQEDKELLLKDLCARLPYGVKVQTTYIYKESGKRKDIGIDVLSTVEISMLIDGAEEHKPYLFPLSSMTEEQMDKVEEILMRYDSKIIFDFMSDGDVIFKEGNLSIRAFSELIQYFDKEMLDHRCLIKKGLAIDCTNLNIY